MTCTPRHSETSVSSRAKPEVGGGFLYDARLSGLLLGFGVKF
jgi:hypothetical protein